MRSEHAARAAAPGPPEPSFAEQARTLLHVGRVGTLSTHGRDHPGFPFGSVAPYALDADGRPTLLFSTMAVHSRNLEGDPRASLLVTQPGWTGDPLAAARVTLLGAVTLVPPAEVSAVRDAYLVRHDGARAWAGFADFRFHRLAVEAAYFVGGFGAMGWVEGAEWTAAAPDPLADAAPRILEHMNADHADALTLYCRAFAGVPADAATMTAVDRLGFRVRARVGDRLEGVRIAFPREARTTEEARMVLVEMVRTARGA